MMKLRSGGITPGTTEPKSVDGPSKRKSESGQQSPLGEKTGGYYVGRLELTKELNEIYIRIQRINVQREQKPNDWTI